MTEPVVASGTPSATKAEETNPPTLTPALPSATPVDYAIQVNEGGISQDEYQEEFARFQAASDSGIVTYGEDKLVEDLVDQLLLSQGAFDAGFVVDNAVLLNHIENIGLTPEALDEWIIKNGYTEESFLAFLTRSVAAAWMRDQIAAKVPSTTEQVHAQQILLYNLDDANEVYDQLQAGTDFGTLALKYNPLTGGDLGWFPRGYLTVSELDDVIFALKPGEYSAVIETPLGYHVVLLIERGSDRPLSPDAYRVLQSQAIQQWLRDRRNQSEIIINLP